jgi:hypothetical protein
MIKRENFHNDHHMSTYDQTLSQALVSLLKYELGFGGQITQVTEEKLVVQTQIFSHREVTIWTGTPAEMAPLLHVAAAWYTAVTDSPLTEAIVNNAAKSLLGENGTVSPIVISFASPFIIGMSRQRAIQTMLALGNLPEDQLSKELVKKIADMPVNDWASIYDLSLSSGRPFLDIMNELEAA